MLPNQKLAGREKELLKVKVLSVWRYFAPNGPWERVEGDGVVFEALLTEDTRTLNRRCLLYSVNENGEAKDVVSNHFIHPMTSLKKMSEMTLAFWVQDYCVQADKAKDDSQGPRLSPQELCIQLKFPDVGTLDKFIAEYQALQQIMATLHADTKSVWSVRVEHSNGVLNQMSDTKVSQPTIEAPKLIFENNSLPSKSLGSSSQGVLFPQKADSPVVKSAEPVPIASTSVMVTPPSKPSPPEFLKLGSANATQGSMFGSSAPTSSSAFPGLNLGKSLANEVAVPSSTFSFSFTATPATKPQDPTSSSHPVSFQTTAGGSIAGSGFLFGGSAPPQTSSLFGSKPESLISAPAPSKPSLELAPPGSTPAVDKSKIISTPESTLKLDSAKNAETNSESLSMGSLGSALTDADIVNSASKQAEPTKGKSSSSADAAPPLPAFSIAALNGNGMPFARRDSSGASASSEVKSTFPNQAGDNSVFTFPASPQLRPKPFSPPSRETSGSTPLQMSPKTKLTKFYQKYNPGKVDEVSQLLEKYKGREVEMWAKLKSKYPDSAFDDESNNGFSLNNSVEDSTQSATLKKLTEFYQRYNPGKVDEVPKLLEKYKGREAELWERLKIKYPNSRSDDGPAAGFSLNSESNPGSSSLKTPSVQTPFTSVTPSQGFAAQTPAPFTSFGAASSPAASSGGWGSGLGNITFGTPTILGGASLGTKLGASSFGDFSKPTFSNGTTPSFGGGFSSFASTPGSGTFATLSEKQGNVFGGSNKQ